MNPSPIRIHISFTLVLFFLAALTLVACEMRLQIPAMSDAPTSSRFEFEATGEDYLISALDEVHAIADWAESFTNGSGHAATAEASLSKKMTLAKTATDTVYIYGQVIAGGYGAVVTERYAYPKGLLLISIRRTHGKENGHIVTETKRYSSHADLLDDNPQQTNLTELFGLQKDTIVTYVLRDGRLETYTFRLPVITKVVNPQDGSVRVTTRYASGGAIVSKVQDGNGNLIQLRKSYGQADGSTVTRTEFHDGSWKQVRTHGEADGTITREITSGQISSNTGFILNAPFQSPSPISLASGMPCPRPPMPPPPPKRSVISQQAQAKPSTITFPTESSTLMFLASGIPCPCPPKTLPPPPGPPTHLQERDNDWGGGESIWHLLASGGTTRPQLPPPPTRGWV